MSSLDHQNSEQNAPPAATPPAAAPDLFASSGSSGEQGPLRAVVRKSSRRRRRRDEMTSPTVAKIQIALLVFIGLLMVLNLAGVGVMGAVSGFLRKTLPEARNVIAGRFELVALLFAALVIVYMMPGVEEKVLTKLGLRRKSNRRERERERERERALRDVRR